MSAGVFGATLDTNIGISLVAPPVKSPNKDISRRPKALQTFHIETILPIFVRVENYGNETFIHNLRSRGMTDAVRGRIIKPIGCG